MACSWWGITVNMQYGSCHRIIHQMLNHWVFIGWSLCHGHLGYRNRFAQRFEREEIYEATIHTVWELLKSIINKLITQQNKRKHKSIEFVSSEPTNQFIEYWWSFLQGYPRMQPRQNWYPMGAVLLWNCLLVTVKYLASFTLFRKRFKFLLASLFPDILWLFFKLIITFI